MPNLFISNLIEEREQRQAGVRQEFGRNWGPEQNLLQPMLVIPYQAGERPRQYVQDHRGAGSILPQRSIRRSASAACSSATVYDASVDMQGAFVVPPEARLRDSSPTRTAASSGTRRRSHSARKRPHGLSSTDNITIDGTPTAMGACLEALRHDPACKGA